MSVALTLKRLKYLMFYDPETGFWSHKVARGGVKVGAIVSSVNGKGYVQVSVDGVRYESQILIWFYMTGKWSKKLIDHEDTNLINNKWKNLRQATHAQNFANSRMSRKNTTGHKNVGFYKRTKKWRAGIAGKHLGYFDTYDEACAVAKEAMKKRYGEFLRL